MRKDIGEYFGRYHLELLNVLRMLYDFGLAQGKNVEVWIDGLELVFVRPPEAPPPDPKKKKKKKAPAQKKEEDPPGGDGAPRDRGFLRLWPQNVAVLVTLPQAETIFDPRTRMRRTPDGWGRIMIREKQDLDADVRRMIGAAYDLAKKIKAE